MTWGYVAIGGATLVAGYMSSQAARSAASGQVGAANSANQLSEAQYQQTRTDMAPWRNAGSSAIGQLSYLLGLPGYAPRAQNGRPGQLGTIGKAMGGPGARVEPGIVNQMSMEDESVPGSLGSGGGTNSAGGPTYNYNDTTGEWTPGDPNTAMGDYGSLSRDFSLADFEADPGYAFRLQEGQKAMERSASAGGRFLGGATLKALTRYGQGQGSQEFGNAYNRFQTNRSTRFNQLAAVAGIGQTANGQLAQLGQANSLTQGNNLMGAANASGAASIAGANGWSSALNSGVNNWLTYAGYK